MFMKKEMSSFDVRALAKDLAALEGSHMDKIFQWDSGTMLFRINVSGKGKVDLYFKDSKWLYMPANKPETPMNPLSFATYLRKYIDNARIGKTWQVGFDRVLIMEVLRRILNTTSSSNSSAEGTSFSFTTVRSRTASSTRP